MRFSLVYNFLSIGYNARAFIFTQLMESTPVVESITFLFGGAVWLEREI